MRPIGSTAEPPRRLLGCFEEALALTADASPFNVVAVVGVDSSPPAERLERALRDLQRRHPLLAARLAPSGRRHAFVAGGVPPPPVRRLQRAGAEAWREVAEEELDRGFADGGGPLVRAVYLSSAAAAGPGEIVLTFHHAVIDAPSLMELLEELVAALRRGAASAVPAPTPPPAALPPPADAAFPARFRGSGQVAPPGALRAGPARRRDRLPASHPRPPPAPGAARRPLPDPADDAAAGGHLGAGAAGAAAADHAGERRQRRPAAGRGPPPLPGRGPPPSHLLLPRPALAARTAGTADGPRQPPVDDLVRSPAATRGYFANPRATARLRRLDGFLATGDLGYLDGDGDLFIVGRLKNLLLHGGRTLAPQEVEEAVDALPFVRASAALGIDRGDAGEQLYVFAEVRGARGAAPQIGQRRVVAIVRAVRDRLGLRPGRVYLLAPGAIPRTANGKVRHPARRRAYGDGSLRRQGRLLFPVY